MAGRLPRAGRALAWVAATGAAMLLGLAPAPAGAQSRAGRPAPRYYLAVGASEAVGVQPLPHHRGAVRTSEGYANDVVGMESTRWPWLRLVDLGCPDITVEGALDGHGTCTYPAGSEVATAVGFLRRHRGATVLVTVDLGFNDLRPCLVHRSVDQACVDTALAQVAKALPVVLSDLRAAGGPALLLVGLLHNDPYVADARLGADAFARASTAVFGRFNAQLATMYRRAGAVVANVPSEFGSGATAPAQMCALSWMCARRNLHPNDAGYRAIAEAITEAVASGRPASAG